MEYPTASTFDFGTAIRMMKDGRRVARDGWNGRGMWLAISFPGTGRAGTIAVPFVFMSTVDGKHVPWTCSQTDMLAEDWRIVPPDGTRSVM